MATLTGCAVRRSMARWITFVELGRAKRAGIRRADAMRQRLVQRVLQSLFDTWLEVVLEERELQKRLRKVTHFRCHTGLECQDSNGRLYRSKISEVVAP